ncbi:hypothetical protein [Pseudoduganella rhizocola]|uniref:hypothetical protein n=1 Tax=Pseudoduganella rhizocola TaxID=3382643 RepID=UPI0038B59AC0
MLPDIAIDGNWVDIGSVLTGGLYMLYRHFTSPMTDRRFLSKQTGMYFANGSALFPLILMVCSVASSSIVRSLLDASRISLAVAGCFALFAILEK